MSSAVPARALTAWRLDNKKYAADWDAGEGAYRSGGRWNSPGVRAVYCSLDAATAMLEVAVHKGFETLDVVPHVMTELSVLDADDIHVVNPSDVPDPAWLKPGVQTPGQQAFGDGLLRAHKFVQIPSVVSKRSWNLIFIAANATSRYVLISQELFVLDPRLVRKA